MRRQVYSDFSLSPLINYRVSYCPGPNGPLPQEIIAIHPDAPFIKRNGEVNAWDNPDFKAAVKATGKKQVILAGITTDVSIFIEFILNID